MEYGERSQGDMLPHNSMRFWAMEEHVKGNYLKARKIRKVAMQMKERYWLSRGFPKELMINKT